MKAPSREETKVLSTHKCLTESQRGTSVEKKRAILLLVKDLMGVKFRSLIGDGRMTRVFAERQRAYYILFDLDIFKQSCPGFPQSDLQAPT